MSAIYDSVPPNGRIANYTKQQHDYTYNYCHFEGQNCHPKKLLLNLTHGVNETTSQGSALCKRYAVICGN